jgi:nicotinate phosphoribosyltransferase
LKLSLKEMCSQEAVSSLKIEPDRPFFSATHEEIANGSTTDVYFIKTYEILKWMQLNTTEVTVEVFPRGSGVMAGLPEVLNLLANRGLEIWALPEGEDFLPKEVILRIRGPYNQFGLYETALLGILASSAGWASAAKAAKLAAGDRPVYCFGARHVHPAVAPVMERAAIVGGADGASCILGAKLVGREPVGTVPHAVFLITGDTLKVAKIYHEIMPPAARRVILVDTFKDEAEEALRVAEALGPNLHGIRLDTPSERGGVTPDLVKEVRSRLDLAGMSHVRIFVSGGLTPEKIILLKQAGADAFGVGSYISGASPIDMTMDIKEVNGLPIAKRGRIPGRTESLRLKEHKI